MLRKIRSPRKQQYRSLVTLLCALLPVLLGVGILYLQAELSLEENAAKTAEEAVREFDLMLDNASSAAREILPLAGRECDASTQRVLREIVTQHPFVRSSRLVWRNDNYCGSLFGGEKITVLNPADFVNGQLWLLDRKPVKSDSSLLIYRVSLGEQSALTTVNSYHLTNALRLISRSVELVLQVGSSWLSQNGQVQTTVLPVFPVAPYRLESTRYPYSIQAGMHAGEVWRYMRSKYPALFCLLVFFGALAGIVGHRLQKFSSAPSHELQRALEAGEFIPFFQPIVHGDSGEWVGVEVLMRWQHPTDGLVRPDLFIPLAESCGLIIPMTRSLLRQTASLLAPHAQFLSPGFHIGVNITAHHCKDMEIVRDCREFLAAFPSGQVTLILELTERELITPSEGTHSLFQKLHEIGVMIAIDDFGTGHSSLAYLRNFDVDYLKIDKAFVAMIGADTLSRHILDSIIELSNKLNLRIIAEGVETVEQRDHLVQKQVDFLQGYFFGRPVPSNVFIKNLHANG